MHGLDRTFEAIVFDWDGTAVRDRRASALAVRRRVEALCARCVDVAVVSGTHLGNIDGQLAARPGGPGRLFLALNRGSELFLVGERGPWLVARRVATAEEERGLDRAATLLIERLAALGLTASLVSQRLNRRKVDIIPEPAWANPPKARIGELLTAVTDRLHRAGIPALSAVVDLALLASKEAGLNEPRVTSDVKHVEIGLTDKSDSMDTLLRKFAERGIGPGLALVVGDEFGALGGVAGSDSLLLRTVGAARLTAISVGVEPTGVPTGVVHRPGGPSTFLRLLDEQLQRRDHRRVPSVDEDPAWTLALTGDDALSVRARQTLLSLGDGVIGVRGAAEEHVPQDGPTVLASGVYDGLGPAEHLLAAPSPLSLEIRTDGQHAPGGAQRRLLDLRTGVLHREQLDHSGAVRTMRFVAAADRGVVVMRAEGPSRRLAPGPPLTQPTDQPMTSGQANGVTWARTVGDRGGIAAATAEVVRRDTGRRVIDRVTAYATDAGRPPPTGRALNTLKRARQRGFDRLLSDHRAAWAQRWTVTNVSIPDDPRAQLAARYALFQLWNSVARRGDAAVGARGLSGSGYAGHVFWDADVFVLPAVATMSPAAARAMLEYRIRRLPQARSIAQLKGLGGVRFPWESASRGDDVTPSSGRADGEWVPILTGQLEEHITADIAWAASHYAGWTGDHAFLDDAGRPLICETARYWATRARTERDGTAHIRHVIGPDEYHENVDDNAYTNVLARWNLRRAAALEAPSTETAGWLRLADALVDGHDPTTGRHEQFAGYYQLEPLLVADIGTPPLAADLLLGAARTSAAQIIKQPDVLMAHHLLPDAMPHGSLQADLDFYLPRTAHGSSLSPAITASLLARAGRPDEALTHLDIALRLDLDDLTGMTASGLHLATLGGVWQALLFGFAGARVVDGALQIDPRLPLRWSSLHLRFGCLGRRVDLRVERDAATITSSGPLPMRTRSGADVDMTRQVHLVKSDLGWVVHR